MIIHKVRCSLFSAWGQSCSLTTLEVLMFYLSSSPAATPRRDRWIQTRFRVLTRLNDSGDHTTVTVRLRYDRTHTTCSLGTRVVACVANLECPLEKFESNEVFILLWGSSSFSNAAHCKSSVRFDLWIIHNNNNEVFRSYSSTGVARGRAGLRAAGRGRGGHRARQGAHMRTCPRDPHGLSSAHDPQNIPPHRLRDNFIVVLVRMCSTRDDWQILSVLYEP